MSLFSETKPSSDVDIANEIVTNLLPQANTYYESKYHIWNPLESVRHYLQSECLLIICKDRLRNLDLSADTPEGHRTAKRQIRRHPSLSISIASSPPNPEAQSTRSGQKRAVPSSTSDIFFFFARQRQRAAYMLHRHLQWLDEPEDSTLVSWTSELLWCTGSTCTPFSRMNRLQGYPIRICVIDTTTGFS